MKQQLNRIFSALLVLVLCVGLFAAVPASAAETGSCGEGLTWSFTDGRLTITGSGKMTDYNQVDLPPWYEYRDQIYYLSLPEGLTNIGDMAFFDCVNLTAVTLPSTVTEIGWLAFCQCRSMTILSLNDGLLEIGRSAFEQCEKLQDLRLPETLTTLGYHAFYACNALRYVKIPASVKQMGQGVFAYCQSLISAEIAAPLEVVPSWTFYGCESLTSIALHQQITGCEQNAFAGCVNLITVYYAGPEENAEQLKEQISADEERFSQSGTVTDEPPENGGISGDIEIDEEGNFTSATTTTVTQTENSTIASSSTTESDGDTETVIEATILGEAGWQELLDAIIKAQGSIETVEVNVYISGNIGLPSEVIDQIVGSNVDMTVQSSDGSQFAVSGSVLESPQEPGPVFFAYNISRMETPDFENLNGKAAYTLTFSHSSVLRVEVMIRVPTEYARSTATLYQVDGRELVVLQSVLVDSAGFAHFYLASVDAKQAYRIGIDVPDIEPGSIIVPEEYYGEYGITANYPDFSQYVITGGQSSWGLSMGQVTWILLGVMVGCVVIVGAVMYIYNRRKLKKGYVPDISEEDWEE